MAFVLMKNGVPCYRRMAFRVNKEWRYGVNEEWHSVLIENGVSMLMKNGVPVLMKDGVTVLRMALYEEWYCALHNVLLK